MVIPPIKGWVAREEGLNQQEAVKSSDKVAEYWTGSSRIVSNSTTVYYYIASTLLWELIAVIKPKSNTTTRI